jgi:hypothetical protein
MNCKQCGAPIVVETGNTYYRCAYCGTYNPISFQEKTDTPVPESFDRPEIAMPKGFTVQKSHGDLKITRDWFTLGALGLTFFCLFWNGFMVFWFGTAINNGAWMMAAFGTVHALVGIAVAYGTLASWINQTVITVNPESLNVISGPLPVPGNTQLKTAEIKQLYTREKVSRGKTTSYSYEVHAVTQERQDKTLVSGLPEVSQALYIEQQIEAALRIQDRPVRGEVER